MKRKRVLTYPDGKSNKFWEIHLTGSEHSVRYGRMGTDGQVKTKTFTSAEKAKKSFEKLVQQKLDKGYVESPAKAASSAKKKPAPAKKVARTTATKSKTSKRTTKGKAAGSKVVKPVSKKVKIKTTATKSKTSKRTTKGKSADSKVVKPAPRKVKKKATVAKSRAAGQQLLRFAASIQLFGPDHEPTSKPSHLKLLDGFISDESLLEYFDSSWDGPELSAGYITCDYDTKAKRLLLKTEYNSDTKLNKEQVARLKSYTKGQWSDGMGEGCFEEFFTLTQFAFETYFDAAKVKTTQTTGVAANSRGRPKPSALTKRWKAVLTKSMAKGGKKELKALLKAMEANDERTVRKLIGTVNLNRGMRFAEFQFDERPPLYFAVWKNAPNLVKLLLDAGADPNAVGSRDAAIHRCAGVETLKLLLAAGADPDTMSSERWTPLMQRQIMQDPEMVKVLLKGGADPNKQGQTSPLLFCAGRSPCLASAKALIEAGAEVSEDAFIAAAAFNELAQFLFGKVDITEQSLKALQHTSLKVARLILTTDVDLNQLIHDYARPKYALQYAMLNGRHGTKIIKMLVEAGADPQLCPDVLTYAIRYESHHATAKILLKHGAVPTEDDIHLAKDKAPKLVQRLRAAMT